MLNDVDLNTLVSNIIAENQFKHCRLCLQNLQNNYVRIQDNVSTDGTSNEDYFQPLSALMAMVLGNEVCEDIIGLDAVCLVCTNKLIESAAFIQSCEYSTNILNTVFDNLTKTLSAEIDTSSQDHSLHIIVSENESKAILVENIQKNTTEICKKEESILCLECMSAFDDFDIYKAHNLTSHGFLTCEVCHRTFANEEKLSRHVAMKHRLKCQYCNMTKPTEEGLRRHQERIHIEYICKECGKCCQGLEKLHLHEHKHRLKYECPKCGKNYRTKDFYLKHIGLCLEDRLDPHPIRAEIEKTYCCEKCGKGYSTPGGLRVHHRFAHENAKPHVCEHCGKEFTAPSYLKIHMVKHTGEKNFKCDICSYLFVSKEALLYHTRRHTGEKPYSCKFCNEKFVNASARAEHIKFKHVGPTLECDVCQRKFVTTHFLKLHMNRHSDPTSKLYCGRNMMAPNVPGKHNLRCNT